MQENTIMTLLSQFVAYMLVFAILSVGIFSYVLSTTTTFQQYMNYQVEMNGGLTDAAILEIQNYHASGNFQFSYDYVDLPRRESHRRRDFGETIDYTIEINIEPLFFSDQKVTMHRTITGLSRSRTR